MGCRSSKVDADGHHHHGAGYTFKGDRRRVESYEVKGTDVTMIGNKSFSGCDILKSVTFSPDISIVGDKGFQGCTSLTEIVVLPEQLVTIGYEAFSECASLKDITNILGFNLKSIEGCAFFRCTSLVALNIPPNVEKIRKYAFKGCIKIEDVTIPPTVTNIDPEAFSGCDTALKIAKAEGFDNVEEWGRDNWLADNDGGRGSFLSEETSARSSTVSL
jgi:hypothetical protein